jgi:hypothetical protein
MPTNTAEQVAALRKRRAQATNVDGVNVDFALLDALLEAWDNWQMVEAMPRYTSLEHRVFWGTDIWWVTNNHEDESLISDPYPAAALAAAFREGTDGE